MISATLIMHKIDKTKPQKAKAHGTWCIPLLLPDVEVLCSCLLRGQGPHAVALRHMVKFPWASVRHTSSA